MKKKRSNRQLASDIDKCCKEIQTVERAINLANEYDFISENKYKKGGRVKFFKDTCEKYDVNSNHIKKIMKG